ncbi:MAG: alginate export family protein, partial [candidate division Zixibacteria bacterium]|nr:alginate export family protein [candidate division Zixibacteria bacterium]
MMRRGAIAFAALMLSVLSATALAETTLKVSSQVRIRFELDGRSFGLQPTTGFTDMRSRVGVSAVVDSSVTGFIQLQDSRRWGAWSSDRPATNTTANIANVDLHQAYMTVNNFPAPGLNLQAGRFELSFGNERMIGS